MLARGTRDSIRNDILIQIFLHSLHVGGNPRTVDNDNLVSGYTVKANLARPKLWRRMKLDLVESASGLIAEIDVPVGYFPLGRNIVFQSPKEVEQAGFRHEMLVRLVRKFGQMIRPTQSTASMGPIQIGAELP